MFTYTTGVIVSMIIIFLILFIKQFGTLDINFNPLYYLLLGFGFFGWYCVIGIICLGVLRIFYLILKWIILSFKINNGI